MLAELEPLLERVRAGTLSSSEKKELDQIIAVELRGVKDVETIERLRNWSPRPYQQALWSYLESGGRRACLIWHRRSGKDDVALNWTARAAHERIGEYWHMLPEAAQGRKVVWDAVSPHTGRRRIDQAFPLDFREKTREQDMVVQFKNGSLWRVVGSDNYNSLMGATPVGVVFSEWALADPNAWAFLRPILMENGGWAMFITTPRGPNHAKTTYNLAKQEPGWFGEILTVDETGVFTKEQLGTELRELQHDYGIEEGAALFEQEYNCSFDAALVGSYYGAYLTRMTKAGRIGNVPIDRGVLVHTAWDLGISDSTAIWFVQCVGKERRLVDYHEASGVGLDEYARVLEDKAKKKGWLYGHHYFPHDIEHRELSNGGLSRVDTLKGLGLKAKVVPQSSVMDGINAVRRMLDSTWIDEIHCERGLNALRNYSRAWNEKTKMFSDGPKHDWACVTEETLVLTKDGPQRISGLPNYGEVLTPCGWKLYHSPRITRKNAPLVEVTFKDGLTVNCTEEHLFLTDGGWKSALSLQNGSRIQSSLTKARSILTANSIAFFLRQIDIILAAAATFIFMCGRRLSARGLPGFISIIEMMQDTTTGLRISNAWRAASILGSHGVEELRLDTYLALTQRPESVLPIGTVPQRGVSGTSVMPRTPRRGRNGSVKIGLARIVGRYFRALSGLTDGSKNIAAKYAKRPLIISDVRKLNRAADVWCLTVEDGSWWTLANGAVTHNSHGADALRTFACGYRDAKEKDKPSLKLPDFSAGVLGADRGTGWMAR